MAQEFEFDVINAIAELDFVAAISPMAATDKGYTTKDDLHPRYANNKFQQLFKKEMDRDGDEYPAVYQISFTAPEEVDMDFDEMMRTIEDVVDNHHPFACIGNYDAGVPKGDWSGWDIDPIVDVLCVRTDLD